MSEIINQLIKGGEISKVEIINKLIEENLFDSKCVLVSYFRDELVEGTEGSSPHFRIRDDGAYIEYHEIPNYWTDIEYAFDIVEKLKLTVTPSYDGWRAFQSNTSGSTGDTNWIGTTNNQTWVKSESITEAICLAALKILKIDIDELKG